MSGTFCLNVSSTLQGNPGVIFYFNPKTDTSGSMSYTREKDGCTETGIGDYTVSLDGETGKGTVSWSVAGTLTCPEIGAQTFTGGESFDITADPDASCGE